MGHFCRKADGVDAQIHERIYNDRHSKRADNQCPPRGGRDVKSLFIDSSSPARPYLEFQRRS
jgi:hypothetical protein